MPNEQETADQLMCDHRWERTGGDAVPVCAGCGLGYADYAQGTVRAALMRMDAWD